MDPCTGERFYETLYNCILHDDIAGLIDLAHSIWKLPVSVIDTHYNLIAFSPKNFVGDPVWDEIAEKRKITPSASQIFLKGLYMKDIGAKTEPYAVDWGVAKKNHRLIYRVCADSSIYGAISVVLLNGYKWDDNSSRALKNIADACGQIMMRQAAPTATSDAAAWFLTGLLENGSLAPAPLEILKRTYRTAGRSVFQMICVSDTLSASLFHINNLQGRIAAKFPETFVCRIGNRLYALLAGRDDKDLARELGLIEEFVSKNGYALFGVSRVFFDIALSPVYKAQADFAFRYAEHLGLSGVHYYEKHMLRHIHEILHERIPPECLKDSELEKLRKYDSKNDTEYAETLEMYLFSFLDSKKTASALNIHRNTLFYRLDRIQEIAELNYNDATQILRLLLTFFTDSSMERIESILSSLKQDA